MMKCPNCGLSNLSQDAVSCPNCGASIEGGGSVQAPEKGAREQEPGVALQAWIYTEKLPPRRFQIFGREEEITAITTALREYQTVLLHGEAGAGKSTLAIEAVRRLGEQKAFDDGSIWVNEIGTAPVAAICDAIANCLGDKDIPKQPPQNKPASTLLLLSDKDVLIILDNLKSSETARQFVRRCLPPGRPLLVTSRKEIAGFDRKFQICQLSRDKAIELFRDRAGIQGEEEVVCQVCDLLENNTLALALAAPLVNGSAERLLTLHSDLIRQKAELQSSSPQLGERLNVWAALDISYSDLNEDMRDAFTRVAASFGDSVGISLLAEICDKSSEACEEIIAQLVTRMFVEKMGNRASVHPLLRDYAHQALGADLARIQDDIFTILTSYAARFSGDTHENHSRLEAEMSNLLMAVQHGKAHKRWKSVVELVEHLYGMLKACGYWADLVAIGKEGIQAAEYCGDDEALLRITCEIALIYARQGNYTEADAHFQRTLGLATKSQNRKVIADTLYHMGLTLQDQRKHKRATKAFQRSREIYKELLDKSGEANSLHQMAVIALREAKYDEAESLNEEALKLRLSISPDDPEIALSLNNIALLTEVNGGRENYMKAMQYYAKALALYEKDEEKYRIEREGILNNQARLYYTMGEYMTARKQYEHVLDMRQKSLGPSHPDVAQILNNLAGTCYAMKEYPAAISYLQQALEIYRTSLGEKNPRYASSLNNLAGLHYVLGNYREAETLYIKAEQIYSETVGKKHPEYSQILNNLGLIYQAEKRYEEAEKLFLQAKTIRLETVGKYHPAYPQVVSNLALLYEAQGDYEKAKEYFLESLKLRREAFGEWHPDVARSLENLAELYQVQGAYSEAGPLLERAIEIYRQVLGSNHQYVVHLLQDLAVIEESQGRYEKAISLYQQALEALGESDPASAVIKNNLADLLRAKGDYRQAGRLYQEVGELYRQHGEAHPSYLLQNFINLGKVAQELRELDKALDSFNQAMEIADKVADPIAMAYVLSRQGQVYYLQGAFEQARSCYQESLNISEKATDQLGMARTLHQLGLLAVGQKRVEEARGFFNRSLKISQDIRLKSLIADNLTQLAELARDQGQIEEADHYVRQSYNVAPDLGFLERMRSALIEHFSDEDLYSVISAFGIEESSLPGTNRTARVNEIVSLSYQNDRVRELQDAIKKQHPDIQI